MSTKHPTPWKIAYWTNLSGKQEYDDNEPIQDANGNPVIVTDDGYYPPDSETVKEIVAAVNSRAETMANGRGATVMLPKQAVLDKLREIGGCGADEGSFADGWDKAIDQACDAIERMEGGDHADA